MRILIIHNKYGVYSGEEAVVESHIAVLKKHGHDVCCYTRSSGELESMRYGKVVAFFSAFYNPGSARKIESLLKEFQPDVVHIHNLYPLISPAVLPVIRKAGVPVVMTVHNYRLLCPNGLFYNRLGICEACAGGKEWYCIRYDCEGSMMKSFGYAMRNVWVRRFGLYTQYVNAFLCLTDFQRGKLIENGFPSERCRVLPNFLASVTSSIHLSDAERKVFLFLGRLNRQKGVDILLKAAAMCPDIPFYLAGVPDSSLIDTNVLPSNVRWLGVISGEETARAFGQALALVFTSRSYEGFPMVFLEAMQHSVPVIAPRLAGIPEIIRDGYNGWLFTSEDVDDLVKRIKMVHEHPEIAVICGRNGSQLFEKEYGCDVWYGEYLKIADGM